MGITTNHKLSTQRWRNDVRRVTAAVERFAAERTVTNDCHVALFEIDRDRDLHVNVTHRYRTRTATGWAGPARLAAGFVHNRRFAHGRPPAIIAGILEMVSAARV